MKNNKERETFLRMSGFQRIKRKDHNDDESYMYLVIGSIFKVFAEASKRIVSFLWRGCISLSIYKECSWFRFIHSN